MNAWSNRLAGAHSLNRWIRNNEVGMGSSSQTYYEIFSLRPTATSLEIEASFRKLVARYRVTTPVEHLIDDKRFYRYLNAYLTLKGPLRIRYDEVTRQARAAAHHAETAKPDSEEMDAFARLSPLQQRLLIADMAIWRREMEDAIHQLRRVLEDYHTSAEAWALLGEVFFVTHRLDEGIASYERAIRHAPKNEKYQARLQHAQLARDGKVDLYIEPSPEEILLQEARRKRLSLTISLTLLGLLVIVASFLFPITPYPMSLFVPWKTVAMQALGVFLIMLALAYGRLIRDFESVMVWSSLQAGDRGTLRQYPYGLLLFITGLISLVLSTVTLIIMAVMDEEWPLAPSLMMGLCLLVNWTLTAFYLTSPNPLMHEHWTGTMLVGGNALVPAAMLGWWIGSQQPLWEQ